MSRNKRKPWETDPMARGQQSMEDKMRIFRKTKASKTKKTKKQPEKKVKVDKSKWNKGVNTLIEGKLKPGSVVEFDFGHGVMPYYYPEGGYPEGGYWEIPKEASVRDEEKIKEDGIDYTKPKSQTEQWADKWVEKHA